MRLSQNPTTGIVEAYTDEGVFIGPIYSQGDFVGQDDSLDHMTKKEYEEYKQKRKDKKS